MEAFTIRVIETAVEFESIVIKAMAQENWRPGLKDAECYFACDPTGSLVGEVNGKPVGCVTLMKYGDTFGFIGSYIVSKEHRGKGYGMAIFNAALSSVKPSRILAGAALLSQEAMYKKLGFSETVFYGARFDFHLPTAVDCLPEISQNSHLSIKCVDQVDWETLLTYDNQVFGFPRRAFLSKWLHAQGTHARVAISSEGSVVGYVAVRPTFIKQDGYKIGPLFADSEQIAEVLLKAVFKSMFFQQEDEPEPVVCIDTFSEKGKQLASRLQGKTVFDLAYMITHGKVPKACFDKWFGATSVEIG